MGTVSGTVNGHEGIDSIDLVWLVAGWGSVTRFQRNHGTLPVTNPSSWIQVYRTLSRGVWVTLRRHISVLWHRWVDAAQRQGLLVLHCAKNARVNLALSRLSSTLQLQATHQTKELDLITMPVSWLSCVQKDASSHWVNISLASSSLTSSRSPSPKSLRTMDRRTSHPRYFRSQHRKRFVWSSLPNP